MDSRLHFKIFCALALCVCVHACGGDDPVDPKGGDDPGERDKPVPAVTAPDAPAGLKLTSRTETSLSFEWNAAKGAVTYSWQCSDNTGVEVGSGSTDHTFVTVSGLKKATEYSLRVRSVNTGGQSDWCAAAKETTDGKKESDNPGGEPGTGTYADFKIPSFEEDGIARAFPGAEGGGMYTTGGRGGQVIHVTNLNDSGAGSLRDALSKKGPRVIVFDVAGVIELQSTLRINNGDVTIAGQTAPGDGICIKNYATYITADNVIIRFVRFRLGDKGPNAGDSEDCIWGRYQSNVILDHCSMSWSIDECASFYGNENFTLQWCVITESLNNSLHVKGNHGYGGIWGGKNASFHHNLLSDHNSRNPRFDHPEIYQDKTNPARRGNVDYRNNIVYNWGDNSTYGGEGASLNIVNNYYKPGPASRDRKYFLDANGIYTSSKTDYGYPMIYIAGNVHDKYSDISQDNLLGIYWHDHKTNTPPDAGRFLDKPLEIVGPSGETVHTTTHSADDAFDAVCSFAGASLSRDRVDDRAAADACSGKVTYPDGGNGSRNGIIDTQDAVGGWPAYEADEKQIELTADSDGDGMPDWFERLFSLSPSDPSDGSSKSLDQSGRYTNLDLYLHYLVRDIVEEQTKGGDYIAN